MQQNSPLTASVFLLCAIMVLAGPAAWATPLPKRPLDITAVRDSDVQSLIMGRSTSTVLVRDIAELIADAFEIPVSAEEPWRPDHTPLPFDLPRELHITKGMTLSAALDHIVKMCGGFLDFDLSHGALVIFPRYAEHRILSSVEEVVEVGHSGTTAWEAMKAVAKAVNCGDRPPSKIKINPTPEWGLKLPAAFTERECIEMASQAATVRVHLCRIMKQSTIPMSYTLYPYYRPTQFPGSKPMTIIRMNFQGPGLQERVPRNQQPRMSNEEMAWWAIEIDKTLCEREN